MQPAKIDGIGRFFAGMAEYTFQTQLGVVDTALIDYLSDLLTRFVRQDVIYRLRDPRGRHLVAVAEMLAEAEKRVGQARREIHRHVGDFTLFWSGVYPETVTGQSDSSSDRLLDYQAEGKRSYWIASTIESAADKGATGETLERLSENFELCAYGLREVRREWERRDDIEPGRPILLN